MSWFLHSGFHVHAGVGVPEDDRAFALRLARYCARNPERQRGEAEAAAGGRRFGNPVALERMTSDPVLDQVTYRSDKADGPTAGTATVDPLEFLAALVTHITDPGHQQTGPLLKVTDSHGAWAVSYRFGSEHELRVGRVVTF